MQRLHKSDLLTNENYVLLHLKLDLYRCLCDYQRIFRIDRALHLVLLYWLRDGVLLHLVDNEEHARFLHRLLYDYPF